MDKDGWKIAVAGSAVDGRDGAMRLPYGRSASASTHQLNAVNPKPQPKLKHQVYYELIEADNRKKKLEFEVTGDRNPPESYEFVPIGNPELTTLCKDLSRENGVKIYMVSATNEMASQVAVQMTRVGHHFSTYIIEEAQMELGYYPAPGAAHGVVEPIPNTQEEINAQADAAIRDLFPRIPNTDRQQIIDHAFQKGKLFNGAPVVGLVANLPLSRRVQLAVLAHIRHNHTRYDDLLRQTNWTNARKTVERVCLDILVKWRGDEENGRDDLETILREIVVISDSEDDDEDGDESDGEESEDSSLSVEEADAPTTGAGAEASKASRQPPLVDAVVPVSVPTGPKAGPKRKVVAGEKPKGMSKKALKRQRRAERKAAKLAKRSQRGFQRYKAAWKQAVDRNRENGAVPPSSAAPMARSISHGSYVAAEPGQAPGQPAYVGAAHELVQVVPQPRPKNNLAKPAWARGHGGVPEDFLPLEPRNGAFGVNQASLTERKVASLAHERPRPSSLGPASPVRNRYQDLLVPSIEPLSPGSASHQPQFIRTLPPRKHAREESIEYRPMMQHNISPASPPTPVYHDVVSKRHRVAMNDNVRTKGWTDYRVPSGQQNYSGPSTVAKSYQGLSATESINHRIGPPGVELIHRQSPRMIVEACERDRTFTEIRGPPRSRGNPIIVDSYEPRSEPVIVTRIPDVNRGPSRRIQDDYDIVEIRRPVPNDNYYGEAWGAASAQGISPRVPAHETFAVDRPRESRPTVYYYSDGEGQPRPQPTPEPIYIRTVEPRGSVREYMGPAVERAPATSLNRDAYRPGLISAPLRTRPVEPYHDDRQAPQPFALQPTPFPPRDPRHVAPQPLHQPPPHPQTYTQPDASPQRNFVVMN